MVISFPTKWRTIVTRPNDREGVESVVYTDKRMPFKRIYRTLVVVVPPLP